MDASSTSIRTLYSYNAGRRTEITEPGFIIAGNNTNGTQGVSNTTLTGRQWGIAPRLGVAWQPEMFQGKVVVRSGFGMYYDRGELFSYFSPGYAIGTVTGGPFGVNQQLPFVNAQTVLYGHPRRYYATVGSVRPARGSRCRRQSGEPVRYSAGSRRQSTRRPRTSSNYLPNVAGIEQLCGQPISLGVYDRANKLPYTFNYTLDIQWQPRNDIAVDIGYVGNVGRHQVIPVPFNQPDIASPTNPTPLAVHDQKTIPTVYTVGGRQPARRHLLSGDYEGGNVDLRVPYIGYAAESIDYKAAGIDAYNALQVHVEKRMSHDFQFGLSYTYSHATDEQSGLGLFYNGNNPLNLQKRIRIVRLRPHPRHQFHLRLPGSRPCSETLSSKAYLANGWQLVGLTVLQSGQPYSIIDLHWRGRQHLLQHLQRHHQPDRPAGAGLHSQERQDWGIGRLL